MDLRGNQNSITPAPKPLHADAPAEQGPPSPSVTIVIPAYNEERAIGGQIKDIRTIMDQTEWAYEVIVVDDGSTDGTASEAANHPVQLISFPGNRGYGAAIKAGIARARAETIVIIDADGSYPSEAIPVLLGLTDGYDMVVGARTTEINHTPFIRRPAKWFLRVLASYLAGQHIPDLNSGLRVMKKNLVQRFNHLLPSGFSFTTSVTLALMCNDYLVRYHPIDYYRRTGRSKVRPKDAYGFLLLIVRTIVYFNPLRVFIPLGGFLFFAGLTKLIYDIGIVGTGKISASAGLGFLGSVIIWTLGLLADQIARIGFAMRQE
jgi:glycosyltransferase involved in cell wall biosynthesis